MSAGESDALLLCSWESGEWIILLLQGERTMILNLNPDYTLTSFPERHVLQWVPVVRGSQREDLRTGGQGDDETFF